MDRKQIREDINNALKEIEKKHGVNFHIGTISYRGDDSFSARISCFKSSIEEEYAENYRNLHEMYMMKEEWLNKEIELDHGVHRLIGIAPNSATYPIVIKRITDGQLFKTTANKIIKFMENGSE